MAKFNVATIKKEAERILETYRSRPGKAYAKNLKIWQMRIYVKKVLFLCKQIEKLKANK